MANTHAVTMGPDGSISLTDTSATVRKHMLEREILLTIGTPGKPARPLSGRLFTLGRRKWEQS
jgi:hypothetical protein